MSIKLLEYEPQLILPTESLEEALTLLFFLDKLSGKAEALPVGHARNIRNSKLSVSVRDSQSGSIGVILENDGDSLKQIRVVDDGTPAFLLGEACHVEQGDFSGQGMKIKALVYKAKN